MSGINVLLLEAGRMIDPQKAYKTIGNAANAEVSRSMLTPIFSAFPAVSAVPAFPAFRHSGVHNAAHP
jgi:hypothetical protein